MNFEVNEIQYLLMFNQEWQQWMLLTPENEGWRRIPIHDDGAPLMIPSVATPAAGEPQGLN